MKRRKPSRDQPRFDFYAKPRTSSDLDREVAEHVEATRREPLPVQIELFADKEAPHVGSRATRGRIDHDR